MKKTKKYLFLIATSILLCCGTNYQTNAATYYKNKLTLKQPDNSQVDVIVTGDEYYQQIESLDGYTLCRNDEGFICYADVSDDNTKLIASDTIYTGNDYNDNTSIWDKLFKNKKSRSKHNSISDSAKDEERDKVKKELYFDKTEESEERTFNDYVNDSKQGLAAKTTEQIKGLTLIINFPDLKSSISRNELSNFFNQPGYRGFNNNGSVRDYFYDISNGAVEYTNIVTEFYTARYNKSYYDNANTDGYEKALVLVREALNWLKSTGFDFSQLSVDRYGELRGVNILYAGDADAGWAKGLWPHQGYIPEGFSSNGVNIHKYELSNIGSDLSLATICHENGHLLFGYPDLYDYTGNSGGCGTYSTMSYNLDPKNPIPPDPYCRNIISKWNNTVNLNSLNNSVVTANSSDTANQNVFKWSSNLNPKEYYLIENLQKSGRYSTLPDDGLMIWHIDEAGNNSNYQNNSNKHYQVSVVQADNRKEIERNINGGNPGDLFCGGYKDTFNDSTSPSARWWNNTNSGLSISNISSKGRNMTFKVGNSNISPDNDTIGFDKNDKPINIASKAGISTSFCSSWESVDALNDGYTPTNSNDRAHAVYGNWPETGTQWVQYTFDRNYIISRCDLYWFKDGQGIDVPSSYKIQYFDGQTWRYVTNAKGLGTAINRYNQTTFDAVTTNAIRVEINSNGKFSTGILEWGVYGIQRNVALKGAASTSYCSSWESINALNDGYIPTDSNDRAHAVYGNWPKTGTQWVQYTFDRNYTLSKCDIYWFKDNQGIDVPSSYDIEYWDGESWKKVPNAYGLGTNINTFNTTTFTPVNTNAIRININSNGEYSTGILEWRVY